MHHDFYRNCYLWGDNMSKQLVVPKTNPNVLVTLNIGLNGGIAWGKYKHENYEHGSVRTLVDILDTPYRVARILEQVKGMAYQQQHFFCGSPVTQYEPDIRYRVAQSNTEATLVVQFEGVARDVISQVFALAEFLKQDCIAVWIHNDTNGGIGQLIGRYNYVWDGGYFNPEYFIHLENN